MIPLSIYASLAFATLVIPVASEYTWDPCSFQTCRNESNTLGAFCFRARWLYHPCSPKGLYCDFEPYITFEFEFMPMNVSSVSSNRWFGIGFSLDEAMPNSDIVTAYLNETNGRAIVEDRFADGRFEPSKAGDSQNETILSAGSRHNGSQVIRFTRRVFSDDDRDVNLSKDGVFVLIALGSLLANGSLGYHAENRWISPGLIYFPEADECHTCDCPMTPHFGRIEVENEDDYGILATPFPGTMIRISCEPGYHLHGGPSERTCQANGEWTSSDEPECESNFVWNPCQARGCADESDHSTCFSVSWLFVDDILGDRIIVRFVGHTTGDKWYGIGFNNGIPSDDSSSCGCPDDDACERVVTRDTTRYDGATMIGADFIVARHAYGDTTRILVDDRHSTGFDVPALDDDQSRVRLLDAHFDSINHEEQVYYITRNLSSIGNDSVDFDFPFTVLVASGDVRDDGGDGEIAYHFAGRDFHPCPLCGLEFRDTCRACPVHRSLPNQRLFYGERLNFPESTVEYECLRGYEIEVGGVTKRECTLQGVWNDSQPTCDQLSLWSNCDVVACSTLDPSRYATCLNASWISHEDDGDGAWLTVELRRRVDDVLPPGYGVWLGFGFSHTGTMCDSDLTTAYVSLSDGRLRVEDRHGNASGRPVIDDDQSQVRFATGRYEDGEFVVQFSRYLDTNDAQDVVDLRANASHFLVATGVVVPDPAGVYVHGRLMYHDTASWKSPGVVRDFAQCIGCPPLVNETENRYVSHPRPMLLTAGAVAKYECIAPGSELFGNDTRVCLPNGTWTGSEPLCAAPCVTRVDPIDGSVIVNVSNVALGPSLGDTALFSCNSNLTLCGNETLTCEANGNWSAPDPLCRLFCTVQEVYVGDRVFNVCIEYTRARELKPLIAEPAQLSISALGSVGWKQVMVTLSQLRNSINEEIRQSAPTAVRTGRLTADEGRDVANGVALLSSLILSDEQAEYIYERNDGQAVNLDHFLRSLFYSHFLPEDFDTRFVEIIVIDIYGFSSPALSICIHHFGINDDSPEIQQSVTKLNYTEDSEPIHLFDNSLQITDPDHDRYKLRSATCLITPIIGPLNIGDEILAVESSCPALISSTYDEVKGELKMSGNATEDDYSLCLNAVTYEHRGEVAFAAQRDVTCSVSDGIHTDEGTVTIMNINVNDAPVVSFPGDEINASRVYTENGPDTVPFEGVRLNDSDNLYLQGARIIGLNLLDGDRVEIRQMHHSLSFDEFCEDNRCGIEIFGMATIDTYTQVVTSAIFKNAGVKPYLLLGGQRFVVLSIYDGELESNAVTVTVDVVLFNDPPVFEFANATDPSSHRVDYLEDGPPVRIAESATPILFDVDSATGSSLRCTATGLRDDAWERLTVDATMAQSHGLTVQTDLIRSDVFELIVVGNSTFDVYLSLFLTVAYENARNELTGGVRLVYCSVADSHNAASENVTIFVDVIEKNDPIEIRLGVETPTQKTTFVEGSLSGVYVINAPHRVEAFDSEGHGVERVEFTLRSDPPGYLDLNEFIFLLKTLPDGLAFNAHSGLHELIFTSTVSNLSLDVITYLARAVMYFHQADEPTLFVNETIPIHRYIDVVVHDTGHPSANTTITIEVCIRTINDHAPKIQFSSLFPSGSSSNCISVRANDNGEESRESRSVQSFAKSRRLDVVGLLISSRSIKPGTYLSVHFSANTNKPRVLRSSDLASVLRVEPSQIRAVPHIGLWNGNETLVILFTGYGQKGWDIPSDLLSITFRTSRGRCHPEEACKTGVCNEMETSCPATGSYSSTSLFHNHHRLDVDFVVNDDALPPDDKDSRSNFYTSG